MNACLAVWSEKKILCCASTKFYYFYVSVYVVKFPICSHSLWNLILKNEWLSWWGRVIQYFLKAILWRVQILSTWFGRMQVFCIIKIMGIQILHILLYAGLALKREILMYSEELLGNKAQLITSTSY